MSRTLVFSAFSKMTFECLLRMCSLKGFQVCIVAFAQLGVDVDYVDSMKNVLCVRGG